MKIEVIITYWGKFEIPKVVLDSWDNQTDKDFKLNLLKIEYPIYRNISLINAMKNSDADVFMFTDGDCIYGDNVIETMKQICVDKNKLYFYNRLLLNEDTSNKLINFEITPSEVIPINDITSNDVKFRNMQDNNFPNNPGAFGYCQIAYRELFNKIIPTEPILGWSIYDDLIQTRAENIMIMNSYCLHLHHRRDGISKNDSKAVVKLMPLDRYDFGLLFNYLNLNGVGLELGVQKGVWAEQVAKKWAGKHLFLVDIWEHQDEKIYNDSSNVSTEEHLKNMIETINRVDVIAGTDYISVLRMTSRNAVQIFPNDFLDWVYLDANHSFLDTKWDISRWYHKVRPGGIIAGDDWDWPSVNRAVYEIILALGNNITVTVTTVGNKSWFFTKPLVSK